MDFNLMAQTILNYVGGKENVIRNMICISRLRLELKDESKVKTEEIKVLEGILGIIQAENLQIVVGTANVVRIGTEFSRLTDLPLETIEVDCQNGAPVLNCAKEERSSFLFGRLFGGRKKKK